MSDRVIFKRYLNSKTVNLEYFNNKILFFRNKVTGEIIKIAVEHELLFIEYDIQTQPGEKNKFTHFIKKINSPQQLKIAFLLVNVRKSITDCK